MNVLKSTSSSYVQNMNTFSDIATSAWLIDFCHKAIEPLRLEKSFKKFYGRYQDITEKYQRSVNVMVNDSFPGKFLFNM